MRNERESIQRRRLRWREAALLLVMSSLVGVGQRIGTSNTSSGYSSMPNGRDPNTALAPETTVGGDSSTKLMEKRHRQSLDMEQRRLMVREAETILVVATDLSVGLGNDAVAQKVDDEAWKRAESIERMARNVRLRMLGGH